MIKALLLSALMFFQQGSYSVPGSTAAFGTVPAGTTFTYGSTGKSASTCTSATSCSVTISIASGDAIFITYGGYANGNTLPTSITCSDSHGDTFTNLFFNSSTYSSRLLAGCWLPAAGATITSVTVTLTGASGTIETDVLVSYFSYTGTTPTLSNLSALNSGSGTTITAGTCSLSSGNGLAIGFLLQSAISQATTPTNGFSAGTDAGVGSGFTASISYLIASSVSSYTAKATISTSASWLGYTGCFA